ncbi:hypothetical protein E0Z10_g7473 [Xylaria hypoxylon]|uniref:DUF7708 domain-containing protein n=1 Tax=Xylaria hypoxylon TaxID=37992 RepID=A0A4Z0YQJ4_9PEZI|nr:hypothetical protein E0Z10_g7473 [Xylaria hypoxylon]
MATVQELLLNGDLDFVSSWYCSPTNTQVDVTKEAYDDAVRYLKREFSSKPEVLSWLQVQTSLADVLIDVEKTERTYRSHRESQTIMPFLRKTASFIMTYGQVVETLVQHHPEYVALVWGTLKFILMGIQNHEKLVQQLSSALSEITDVLPRAEFIAKLYVTDRTRAALSRVYAYVLLFLRQAVKWYARSSTERAVSAFFKPSPLKCENIINQIRACVKTVQDEASVSSQAEIRDIHVEILRHGRRLDEIERKIDTTDLVQTQRWGTLDQRIIEVQTNSYMTIQKLDASNTKLDDMHGDTQDIRYKITDVQATVLDTRARIIQYEEIIQNLAPETSPEAALSKQESIIKRARISHPKSPKQKEIFSQLGNWISSSSPPLLVLHAGPRAQAQAREIATELIGVLQPSVSNVYWSLPTETKEDGVAYRKRILRDLVFQVMRASSGADSDLVQGSKFLDIDKLRNSPSEEELMEALSYFAQRFPQCFFIIDGDTVALDSVGEITSTEDEAPRETLAFFERIIQECHTGTSDAKLLALSNCDALATLATDSPVGSVVKVQWSAPLPARVRKLAIRTRSEKTGWMGVRKSLSMARMERSSSSTISGLSDV